MRDLPLRRSPPAEWATRALAKPLALLNNHAHLEKKAATNALELLHRCPRWAHGTIAIEHIDLSSNRVRVELSCEDLSDEVCSITIEEQSGYVVAGVAASGFLDALRVKYESGSLSTRQGHVQRSSLAKRIKYAQLLSASGSYGKLNLHFAPEPLPAESKASALSTPYRII